MAKAKGGEVKKINFGKRKGGKAKKTSGPKDKPVKKYRGQGKQYYYQHINISKPLINLIRDGVINFVIVNY